MCSRHQYLDAGVVRVIRLSVRHLEAAVKRIHE